MATDDQTIAVLAEHQHGVVSLRQLLEREISRPAIRHRIAVGRLLPLHPGVYRVAGAPPTWRGALLAACLAAPGPGIASHRSAARLWGLPGGSRRFVELTCLRWRRAQLPGLVVHETRTLGAVDAVVVDSIPCLTVERTLLSLGAVLPPAVVELAVDAALRRELTAPDQLHSMLGRLGRPGRNGAGVLRRVLGPIDAVVGMTESVMETRLLQVLRRHGLPLPVPQHEVFAGPRFVARVDAAYPEFRIAIEYDSFEHHTGHAAHIRDSRRRNALVGLGWTVISVTAEDIASGGEHVTAMLRAARTQRLASTSADMPA